MKNSDIMACTSLGVVSIKILLDIYTSICLFLNKYCPDSDGKWTIKFPAKKTFCRNSIRIWAIIEIRQRCPNSSRISKHVEILLQFGHYRISDGEILFAGIPFYLCVSYAVTQNFHSQTRLSMRSL